MAFEPRLWEVRDDSELGQAEAARALEWAHERNHRDVADIPVEECLERLQAWKIVRERSQYIGRRHLCDLCVRETKAEVSNGGEKRCGRPGDALATVQNIGELLWPQFGYGHGVES